MQRLRLESLRDAQKYATQKGYGPYVTGDDRVDAIDAIADRIDDTPVNPTDITVVVSQSINVHGMYGSVLPIGGAWDAVRTTGRQVDFVIDEGDAPDAYLIVVSTVYSHGVEAVSLHELAHVWDFVERGKTNEYDDEFSSKLERLGVGYTRYV